VETRREGKRIYYRLKSKQALAIIDSLYVQFCSDKTDGRRRPAKVAAVASGR
jgi:hypothetical protein